MTTVLYHANCWDGFCAAWVARNAMNTCDASTGPVNYVPVQYGQPFPDIERKGTLYILDFSYPADVLLPVLDGFDRVVIIDHHKTAQAELAKLPERPGCQVIFDLEKSGARLTAEYFGTPTCGVIDYTEDRDMWWWKLPRSREVNACLRSYPLDFDVWDRWRFRTLSELCEELESGGDAILRRERQIVDQHIKHARRIVLSGHNIPCVNATVLFSEIAGELAKMGPFGACYFVREDGMVQWSLRSTKDGIDVSEIAKWYGGGGHKHAAGFESNLSWLQGTQ